MMFPPGEYRVMVRVSGRARRYRVRLEPGGQVVLRINWYTDVAFIVSREWLGFVWPAGLEAELPGFVARVVRQNVSHRAIVLGIVRRGGHRYITARKFERATGAYEDGASIELGAREPARVEALVGFLAVGARSSELLPLIEDQGPPEPASGTAPRWPLWAAAGVAAGGLAAGGYLLHLDGACRDAACMEHRHTAVWGWGALGLGTAAIAFGVYLHFRPGPTRSKAAPAVGLHPSSSGILVTLSGRR